MTKEILDIVEKIRELNDYGKQALFLTLFDKKIVKFPELAKAYVYSLQEEIKSLEDKNSKLILYTSSYCIHDNTPMGKSTRRYIYDIGAYTGKDGSPFGKMLEEEFSNIKNDTTT